MARAAALCPPAGLMFDVGLRLLPPRALENARPAPVVPHARICLSWARRADPGIPRALDEARARVLPADSGCRYRIEQASDPFFGRGGKMMAMSQVEQELKFELLDSGAFGGTTDRLHELQLSPRPFRHDVEFAHRAGETAHTGCVAFGMDRLALALVRHSRRRDGAMADPGAPSADGVSGTGGVGTS